MSKSKFETYPDSAGEYRWRITAANGEIVGASSEGFSSEAGAAKNAFRTLQGLTDALGIPREGSVAAPAWLDEAVASIKDADPPLWEKVGGTARELAQYVLGRPDTPSYMHALVEKTLLKFGPEPE